ncbi:MAG TPA: CoA transferase [Acidimicrobiia bacterium]|jgi:crotonobetainyl-CoA:carnitine CoA-transferase CaiB-like acyl-CoA transferase
MGALDHIRICDFGGQLAGAGATKLLAAFGAEVIRVEDPTTQGRWDMMRVVGPYVDERRGVDLGGGFNNHNVNKLGVTINLRAPEGPALLEKLLAVCDVVTENFAAGVLDRLGFGYEALAAIKPDIIYVSNCGFGHTGPHRSFKTWGPVVQAVSGLTFNNGLPDEEPAGWGFSYMDHGAAGFMAIAILAALHHREVTGEGQWVDLASTTAGITMQRTAVLDWTVNGRPSRRPGQPNGNHADFDAMAPHNIYAALGDDRWVALACRDDDDWRALCDLVDDDDARAGRFSGLAGRLEHQDQLDEIIGRWVGGREAGAAASELVAAGVPASVVKSPRERIDEDPDLDAWGLFPSVDHPLMGEVRVEGVPLHFSETDWSIDKAAPLLGEDNDRIFRELLDLDGAELERLRSEGVV